MVSCLAFQWYTFLQAFDLQALQRQNGQIFTDSDEPRRATSANARAKAIAGPAGGDNSWTGKETGSRDSEFETFTRLTVSSKKFCIAPL